MVIVLWIFFLLYLGSGSYSLLLDCIASNNSLGVVLSLVLTLSICTVAGRMMQQVVLSLIGEDDVKSNQDSAGQ